MAFAHLLRAAALGALMLAPLASWASATQGQPNPACPQFAPAGFPFPTASQVASRAYHICHANYSSYVDPATRGPLWSAEALSGEGLDAEESRTNDFRPDPDIPRAAQASSQRDFARSGYDQGHMAPAGDFRQSPQAMSESFFYSNIVPQNADNNRHAWQKLEIFTRQWAKARGQVFVFTGPIFSEGKSLGFLGASRLAVPTHLFKVVVDYRRREALAFVLPNQPIEPDGGKGSLKAWEQTLAKYQVSVRDIEAWTGLKFDPNMPQAERDALHAQKMPMWNSRKAR